MAPRGMVGWVMLLIEGIRILSIQECPDRAGRRGCGPSHRRRQGRWRPRQGSATSKVQAAASSRSRYC